MHSNVGDGILYGLSGAARRWVMSPTSLVGYISLLLGPVVLLTPVSKKGVLSITFMVLLLVRLWKPSFVRIPVTTLVLFCSLVAVLSCIVLISPFSKKEILWRTTYLFLAYLIYFRRGERPNATVIKVNPPIKAERCVAIACLVVMGAAYARWVMSGYDSYGNQVLLSLDKNYFSVVAFLMLAWCWFRRWWWGVAAYTTICLTNNSRAGVLIVILFYCLEAVRWVSFRFSTEDSPLRKFGRLRTGPSGVLRLKRLGWVGAFTGVFLFAALFSSFWVKNYVGQGSDFAPVEDLNDSSNAMRFTSNMFWLGLVKDNPMFLLYGYDADLADMTGMRTFENPNGRIRYLGYGVVQPHNAVLNLIVQYGALYTVIYTLLLANLFASISGKHSTLSVCLPYLCCNLIMHSLIIDGYLLLFCWVLHVVASSPRTTLEGCRRLPPYRLIL